VPYTSELKLRSLAIRKGSRLPDIWARKVRGIAHPCTLQEVLARRVDKSESKPQKKNLDVHEYLISKQLLILMYTDVAVTVYLGPLKSRPIQKRRRFAP